MSGLGSVASRTPRHCDKGCDVRGSSGQIFPTQTRGLAQQTWGSVCTWPPTRALAHGFGMRHPLTLFLFSTQWEADTEPFPSPCNSVTGEPEAPAWASPWQQKGGRGGKGVRWMGCGEAGQLSRFLRSWKARFSYGVPGW